MPTITSAAVDVHVFCRNGGRPLFLLLHRAPGKRYAGLWRMVAGKLESDETPVQTALRELREETGLRAVNLWALDYLHTFYDPQDDHVNLIPVFAVEVDAMQVTLSEEHDNVRWVNFEQAMTLLRWPGQREGLRRIQEDVVTPADRGACFRVALTHE